MKETPFLGERKVGYRKRRQPLRVANIDLATGDILDVPYIDDQPANAGTL